MLKYIFFYGLGEHALAKPWGLAIATYLFLGGLAGGMFITGFAASFYRQKSRVFEEVSKFGIIVSGIVLVIGLLSLIFDHPNVINAVFNPFLFSNLGSWLAIGSWIILFFLILWFILVVERLGYLKMNSNVKTGIMAVNAFLAFMIILYTALLLREARFVPLWLSFAIPPLFVASGISTGIAICVLYGIVKERESELRLKIADVSLIAFEIIFVAFLIFDISSMAKDTSFPFMSFGSKFSAELILSGTYSGMFLYGFIGIGLILPLILYGLSFIRKTVVIEALSALSVLAGGYLFRIVIIAAAAKAIVLP